MPHVVRRTGLVTGVRIAVLLALVHAVNDALTAILGALLPTLQIRFAAGTTMLALLVATLNISTSVTQPALGALADRIGLRQVAAAGVALAAVSFSLVGVAPTVPVLLTLLVLGGVGSAALHPVSTSIVGGPSATNPGLAIGMFTAGGMVGFAAGPVLILWLVSAFGTTVTPWLMLPGLAFAAAILVLLPDWEPHRTGHRLGLIGRRTLTGSIGWLTAASSLVSLAFITVTAAVPLWLVTAHGLDTDAPLLGWTLAVFSLAAGLGAVAGGALAPRLGYARTATTSILTATLPLGIMLVASPGPITLAAAAVAGALLYASQPLLIVAAQDAVPQAPAAAAGVVIGVATAVAGLLYVGSGVAQATFGLAPAMAVNFALLLPAAYLAGRALRAVRQHDR